MAKARIKKAVPRPSLEVPSEAPQGPSSAARTPAPPPNPRRPSWTLLATSLALFFAWLILLLLLTRVKE